MRSKRSFFCHMCLFLALYFSQKECWCENYAVRIKCITVVTGFIGCFNFFFFSNYRIAISCGFQNIAERTFLNILACPRQCRTNFWNCGISYWDILVFGLLNYMRTQGHAAGLEIHVNAGMVWHAVCTLIMVFGLCRIFHQRQLKPSWNQG